LCDTNIIKWSKKQSKHN